MKRKLYNALIWLDILFNKQVYVKALQMNGFIVDSWISRSRLYAFFRSV